jgi:hypothetical protein
MPQIQIGKQPVSQITIIEAEPEKQAEDRHHGRLRRYAHQQRQEIA